MRFTRFDRRRVAAISAGYSVTLCVLGVTVLALPGTAQAAAAKIGYVRLAHLSPDTPKVDVYLDDLSSRLKQQKFPGVGYGTVSGYLPLPVGAYAVSMRASGAPATSPPVLTTNITVKLNHAYTVAGVGRHADLGLRVISDDLTSPMNGQAKVRIVQASIKAPVLDLSISGGATIATQVQFASTTEYHLLRSGVLTLKVQPSGGGAATLMHVSLQSNSVYTVLVLDGRSGLKPKLLTDAGRAGTVPKGGVETGAGGTAPRTSYVGPAALVAVVALALGIFLAYQGRTASPSWSRRRAVSGSR